jgi:hypothetical protein
MAEKYIVTQSQLGPLKLALSQEADSLAYHANDSLSKAHSFEVVIGPDQDAYGNRLTEYRDSNNDIVGNHMLKLTLGDISYYAPLTLSNATSFPPQTPASSIPVNTAGLLDPGTNVWVTDFATDLTSDAQLVMSNLLLPHTQSAYWEEHASVRAYPYTTLDSAGHTVGTEVLELTVGAQKIWMPASKRLGGPPQTPRITLNPASATSYAPSGQGQPPVGMRATSEGTLPMHWKWQFSSYAAGPWTDIVADVQYASLVSTYSLAANVPGYPPSGDGTIATLGLNIYSGGESGAVTAFYIRCKFYTLYDGVEFFKETSYATISCSDETDCLVLCGVFRDYGCIPEDVFRADKSYARNKISRQAREGYLLWATPVAEWIRQEQHWISRAFFKPIVMGWVYQMAYYEGIYGRQNLIGLSLLKVGVPISHAIGCVYRLWRKVLGRPLNPA